VKFSRFSPYSQTTVQRALGSNSRRRSDSNNGAAFFFVTRAKFISIKTKFTGEEANNWSCSVYRVNTAGRVAFRLFNSAGATVGTMVSLAGYAGLATTTNADATVGAKVRMDVRGAIDNTQIFSSSLSDNTYFSGGRG
jgi:hypothetical protein